jgi:hypothetical protein
MNARTLTRRFAIGIAITAVSLVFAHLEEETGNHTLRLIEVAGWKIGTAVFRWPVGPRLLAEIVMPDRVKRLRDARRGR